MLTGSEADDAVAVEIEELLVEDGVAQDGDELAGVDPPAKFRPEGIVLVLFICLAPLGGARL